MVQAPVRGEGRNYDMNFLKQDPLVLSDHDLAQVLGGADTASSNETLDSIHRLSARREVLINRQDELHSLSLAPRPDTVVKTFTDSVKNLQELQDVTKQLNAEWVKAHLDAATRQAHDADLKELEEQARKDQEAEENDWLKQADAELAAEAAAHQGGGDAGPPANADAGPGETLPSFPTNIINSGPSHEPTIVLEPIEQEHRLY
jgi:hypothetical protein